MSDLRSITLKQLRALQAIASHGSVTRAAEALHLTVPAVSTQLKLLEAAFDAPLLVRSGHGAGALTAQGREVLAATLKIATALEQAEDTVQALNRGQAGSVRLGVVSTGKYFAPRIVALARQMLPEIDVVLKIGNRKEMIHELGVHGVDLAIMGRPPRQPEVDARGLGPNPHVLIAAPDHPLALLPEVTPARLLEHTLIRREPGSGTRILMERYLDSIVQGSGPAADPHDAYGNWLEFSSNETIKQAVIAGLGVALISGHTVAPELQTGRLASITMEGLPVMRRWFLVNPRTAPLPPAATRFAHFLVEEEPRYLPPLPGMAEV